MDGMSSFPGNVHHLPERAVKNAVLCGRCVGFGQAPPSQTVEAFRIDRIGEGLREFEPFREAVVCRHILQCRTQLLLRIDKLSAGEKIASAKRCSAALIKVLLFDPDPRVFSALLVNQRVREDDLLLIAGSDRATTEKLQLIAADRKWSSRYGVRRALVMNPRTPRSVAASQLRFLTNRDLHQILRHPSTSVYLRRCIERLRPTLTD